MRSRLRLFAFVGLVATSIDIGLFLLLTGAGDGPRALIVGDVVALGAAAVMSYLLNRTITFRGAVRARWVRTPLAFAATAVVAGLVDVAGVLTADAAGLSRPIAKVAAVGLAAGVRWTAYRWVLFNEVRRELAERHRRPPQTTGPRLTVVVPAYREEANIATTIESLRAELEPAVGADELELLVVDDGSDDATASVAEAAGARVIVQPQNRGKGAAVRAGVLAATGRAIVFTDADLAYPPAAVRELLAEIEDGWDMVVGSRRHEETTTLVRARRIRELGGRTINWLTHLVLLGHFRDTQCGIKGFRGDIGRAVFERTTIDGFGFDVELFLIAEQDRLSLHEVPVSVANRQGSSVRLVADSIALLRDLVRIRRMAGWGRYRPNPSQQAIIEPLESAVDDGGSSPGR